LAAVATADGAGLVVETGMAALEFIVEVLGEGDELGLVFEEREHGDFDRREARAQAEHGAGLGLALVVGDFLPEGFFVAVGDG
jgi:hypothetical protein